MGRPGRWAAALLLGVVVLAGVAALHEGAEPAAEGRALASSPPASRSWFLVGCSLAISLCSTLAVCTIAAAMLATLGGVPVPLLAALPSGSSACLALQVLACRARGAAAGTPFGDLGHFIWAWPTAEAGLSHAVLLLAAAWLTRRTLARLRAAPEGGAPHDLGAGSWELRIAGVLAFQLAACSTSLLGGDSSWPVLGALAGLTVLFLLAHHVLTALKFVTEVMADGSVVLTPLPATVGAAEVFVDRVCDQLRALPAAPRQPACAALLGDFLTSPAWCMAPSVASIAEVVHRGSLPWQDEELDGGGGTRTLPASKCWRGGGDAETSQGADLEEDELQGKPLLQGGGYEREDTASASDSDSPPKRRRGAGAEAPRCGAVSRAHPVAVAIGAAFDARAADLVAGVACIPWLDCAVPASALRPLQEVCGELVVHVHPGQLCGALTSGRFAACFDWGTRWPWRWSAEVGAKFALGVWTAAPLETAPWPLAAVVHLSMLCVTGALAYCMVSFQPYTQRTDNVAAAAAAASATAVVALRAACDFAPLLEPLAASAAALLALAPCAAVFAVGVGLAGAALDRTEAQGLYDRAVAKTIDGWSASGEQPGTSGCSIYGAGPVGDPHRAVEVILPGQRAAFAIVLPALARPRIVFAQLLPPVPGARGEDPEQPAPQAAALLQSGAGGERARLPVPRELLFPTAGRGEAASTGVPLAALLAPGRAGRLVYAGDGWREDVRDFFGERDAPMADSAERLVAEHTEGAAGRTLVVVEVLPAFASEFVDERREPA